MTRAAHVASGASALHGPDGADSPAPALMAPPPAFRKALALENTTMPPAIMALQRRIVGAAQSWGQVRAAVGRRHWLCDGGGRQGKPEGMLTRLMTVRVDAVAMLRG